MLDSKIIQIEIPESEFFTIKKKISIDQLAEFLNILSSCYKTAYLLSKKSHPELDINIDTCLKALLINTIHAAGNDKNGVVDFRGNINLYNARSALPFDNDGIEIISINYNSPLKINITGKSVKYLVIAIAIMGGEMNLNDFSVKMPGIADILQKLSNTYIEVKKFQNDQVAIDKEVNRHLKSLPHQDINQLNRLTKNSWF
ncbi:hypothetical protein ACRN9G_12550 [Shewanella frigidimarina]|uniref:hypothetical protein n=1 Tax=Shewanella frigidimarina TaxID=56812 RepID=UPI003D78C112